MSHSSTDPCFLLLESGFRNQDLGAVVLLAPRVLLLLALPGGQSQETWMSPSLYTVTHLSLCVHLGLRVGSHRLMSS